MGCKGAEATRNINNTFGPGTSEQSWFKKFYRGDENLEDEEHGGLPSEGGNDQLRSTIKVDALTTTREVMKNST
ncbi:hypothetical protein AV530_008341 [Patagioenas fasciata monilis]|uniref:Mos1 transposase HTH domain-containing protein n=1 Tax=Patagioenas fasciata monilis TaxID=372326 RepID=A0A1V4KPP6_PATFA|nr:hypothetical protein AV530_008341 [Patagioenas fasciata monilis]